MPKNRNDRLANDYRAMLKIQNQPYLTWIVTKGELPYAEEYLLTVKIRTYALSVDSGVHTVGVLQQCTVKVTLWDSYPSTAPNIRMLSIPPVFHPDWYSKGTYCSHTAWDADTSLKDYIIQMIRTLQYDPAWIKTDYPANYKAMDWYIKNRENADMFPSDHTQLSENTAEAVSALEQEAAGFTEIVDCWDNQSR